MKKTLLLSVLAIAAMTACTKNEVFVSGNNDAQISFKPLSATQTKSTPIKKYETTTGDFKVYAWYQATNTSATFDPSLDYTTYMNNVTCSYTAGDVDGGHGEGTWKSADTYFWPKNGKLTFSAYYPSDLTGVSVTADKGLKFTDYKVADPTDQIDVMYSTRVYDRVSSTETDVNQDYDGVDIVFNHALSAASFDVKVKEDYGAEAVKLYKIEILKATANGTFTEGLTTGVSGQAAAPAWGAAATPEIKDYTVFNETAGQVLTTTATKAGVDCIVLPQTFSSDIAIKVTYGIKYKDGADVKYLEQTATFPLENTTTNNGTAIEGWEISKWYKYTLTFTLDTVYFAPSVSNWEDVTVDGIEVK